MGQAADDTTPRQWVSFWKYLERKSADLDSRRLAKRLVCKELEEAAQSQGRRGTPFWYLDIDGKPHKNDTDKGFWFEVRINDAERSIVRPAKRIPYLRKDPTALALGFVSQADYDKPIPPNPRDQVLPEVEIFNAQVFALWVEEKPAVETKTEQPAEAPEPKTLRRVRSKRDPMQAILRDLKDQNQLTAGMTPRDVEMLYRNECLKRDPKVKLPDKQKTDQRRTLMRAYGDLFSKSPKP